MKDRVGQAAVVLFLIFTFLLTGCDRPGHDRTDRSAARGDERSADVGRRATTPVRTAALTEGVPVEAEPTTRLVPEDVTFEDGERAFRDREYAYATALFTAYTERRPENPWGHYMVGLSSWKAGDRTAAIKAFDRALESDPAHVKSRLNAARVLLELERPDDALEHVRHALEFAPGSGEAFRLLGLTYADLGWTEDAIEAFRQAIILNEEDVWSMNNLGLVYIRAGRFDEALGPLARATELTDDIAVFQNNLGVTLERLGYPTAAREAFARAVAIDSSYARAVVSLDRVTGRSDDPLAPPLDLSERAWRFVAEIRGEPIDEVETLEPDSLAVTAQPVEPIVTPVDSPTVDTVPQPDSVPTPMGR